MKKITPKCRDCGKQKIWNLYRNNQRCKSCYDKSKTTPFKERFFKYVKKTRTCWIWTGLKVRSYGQFNIKIRNQRWQPKAAHRISWIIHNGKIPNQKCVLHHCDNPPCVNPSHLFIGTRKDNVIDMVKKGRHGISHLKSIIKTP